MQVKKYEADSVIEALRQVKNDLGPDAIVLSTQEAKKSTIGGKKFIVVAAVTDNQFKKKELAEKKLGDIFENKVQKQSAQKQKAFIESVYSGVERQHEKRNRQITQTRYIDIDDSRAAEPVPSAVGSTVDSSVQSKTRVKQAAQEAFKTSLASDFFKKEPQENDSLLPDDILHAVVNKTTNQLSTPEHIQAMIQRLKSCGVSTEVCEQLTTLSIRELGAHAERKPLVDSWFAKWILNQVQVSDFNSQERLECFVGPHGSGKTTALVKLATHYVVNEQKSVAIITTDLNKVGAVEQLRVYSRILNAPVFVVANTNELQAKINELGQFDKIFVDTPGISLSNMSELDFMRAVAHISPTQGKKVHLVISALTKAGDLGGILKRFRVSEFSDVIVSNIDQTSQHGILLNIQEKIGMPFHSFGIGSDIVDGFEIASRERVLDLIFKLTKRTGERTHDSRI